MRDHREPYTTRKLHLAHLVVRFIYLEDMYIFLGKNFTSLEKKTRAFIYQNFYQYI
ncbi:MAG: hypothetical protein VW810_03505 [Pelagibacteraceae bacterium]